MRRLRIKEGSGSSSYKDQFLLLVLPILRTPDLESMTFTTGKAVEVDTSEGVSPKYELVRDKYYIFTPSIIVNSFAGRFDEDTKCK